MLCTQGLFPRHLRKRKSPIIDLDKIIEKAAWKRVQIPSLCGCRDRPFKKHGLYLKTDWNFLERRDVVESFELVPTEVALKPVQLYRTQFRNFSGKPQTFTFRAERTTQSTMEMTVQQGISVSGNVNFSFSLPSPTIPGGGAEQINPEHLKMTSALAGAQVVWNKSVTDKFTKSETLKWGVDSAVSLDNNKRALASLSVLEARLVGTLRVRTDVTILDETGMIPIDVVRHKGDEVIALAELTAATICAGRDDLVLGEDERSFSAYSTIQCKAVYGVEQVAAIRLLRPGEEEDSAFEGPVLLHTARGYRAIPSNGLSIREIEGDTVGDAVEAGDYVMAVPALQADSIPLIRRN